MKLAYVDANVLLRFLTGDDTEQSTSSAVLLAQAASGRLQLILTETTLAEVVWVLQGRYEHSRAQIADELRGLIVSDGIEGLDIEVCVAALDIYGRKSVDFADALLAARALVRGPRTIYSFDRDFDRLTEIQRLVPGQSLP